MSYCAKCLAAKINPLILADILFITRINRVVESVFVGFMLDILTRVASQVSARLIFARIAQINIRNRRNAYG